MDHGLSNAAFAVLLLAASTAGVLLAKLFPDTRPFPMVAVAHLAIAPVLAFIAGPETIALPAALWTGSLIFLLTAISISDMQTNSIPDAFVFPLIALGVGYVVYSGGPWMIHVAYAAGLTATSVAISYVYGARAAPVGAGDVLLAAAALIWLGPWIAMELFLTAALILVLFGVAQSIRRKPLAEIPLAPAFALAWVLIWFGIRLL